MISVHRRAYLAVLAQYLATFVTHGPGRKSIFIGKQFVQAEQLLAGCLDLNLVFKNTYEEGVLERAMILLRRYHQTVSPVTWDNLSRLLLASLLVMHKFNDEEGVLNKSLARVINLPLSDLNDLEATFLKQLDFCLVLTPIEELAVASLQHKVVLAAAFERTVFSIPRSRCGSWHNLFPPPAFVRRAAAPVPAPAPAFDSPPPDPSPPSDVVPFPTCALGCRIL